MILLAALWIGWCMMHSLLISNAAHDAAKRLLGVRFAFYRLLYVCFSVVSLVPLLWYQFSLPHRLLYSGNWMFRAGQLLLLLYAVYMFYAGARIYDMDYFLGLKQVRSFRKGKDVESLPFHTDGILTCVRHPWYSGGIAFLWGIGSFTDIYLLTRSILTAYFIAGTLLEEARLRRELGPQYTEYSRRVPMLVPRITNCYRGGSRKDS